MRLTRKASFTSGHRYWNQALSPEENTRKFGRWASPYNHGHDYTLEITIRGKVDPTTGMVINIKELDSLMKEQILFHLDQKSLNDEVPYFLTNTPTLENIAIYCYQQLTHLPQNVSLVKIRLHENPTLFSDYTIGEKHSMTITRCYDFCASHRLAIPELTDEENLVIFGKCSNPTGHGHNYELEVTVSGKINPDTGMIVDLEQLDQIVQDEILQRYDHKNLNSDVEELHGLNPTSEVVTKAIYQRLKTKLPVKLERVLLRETKNNAFEYAGEDE